MRFIIHDDFRRLFPNALVGVVTLQAIELLPGTSDRRTRGGGAVTRHLE